MNGMLQYLKPHFKYVILAPLSMIVEVICELMMPKIMAGIVNYGILYKDTLFIARRGALMLCLSLAGVVGGVLCTYFASKASQYFGGDLRAAIFKKIQQFSFTNLDGFQTSSLITRMTNDITQVQQITLISLRMLVRAPLLFIGGVAMAFFINKSLTCILSISICIILVTTYIVLTVGTSLFRMVQEKVDKLNTVMRENLSGIRVVKAFVQDDYEREKFKKINLELSEKTIHSFQVLSLSMPIFTFSMNVTLALVLWFGGKKVSAGLMPTGDLMAYITYLTQILMALMMVGTAVSIISRGKASIDRIREVLETEVDITDPAHPQTDVITGGFIEFEHVSFRYPNSTGEPVLCDINLQLPAGKTIGILGQTGSGKSTFVNLIPRLYDVTEGAIRIDCVDIRQMSLHYLREQVGMVLQQSILFSGTIKDNVRWGKRDATDEDIDEALQNAGAYSFVNELTQKADTHLNQMGVNVSGGQKQRLSIARTLLKKPKILILDDSTSAVDSTTEANIHRALYENLPSCTKLIIAQKISTVRHADKIIIIDGGRVVAEGTHEQLMASSPQYLDIYHSQSLKAGDLDE